jgi:putative tricarboxylic transport membrane protein
VIRLTNIRDFWSGIVLGLLGLVECIGAFQMPFGSLDQPDDGFMPLWVGAVMLVLSALLTLRSLGQGPVSVTEPPFWLESKSPIRIACILGAMSVYLIVFEGIGFALATFVLLIFLLRTIDPVPWRFSLLMGLSVTAFCVLLFQVWLQVQLPMGWLSGWRMGPWIF